MYIITIAKSVFDRGARRSRKSARYRPHVTALESRCVPTGIGEFPLPPLSFGGEFGATSITSGSDGNLWFTDPVAGSVGRITPSGAVTEFVSPLHSAGAITAGPDGNLWFSTGGQFGSGDIARITPSGQITVFTLPDEFGAISSLTAGPDGNVWFAESIYPTGETVGKITPTGQITEFSIPVPSGVSGRTGGITAGPDGNLWFTHDGILAMITPSGALRDHVANVGAAAIASGPDGNLWTSGPVFDLQTGDVLGDSIQRISLSGSVTSFSVGTTSASPSSISAGSDGNLWFTEPDANQIGRITTAGAITLFTVPTSGSQPTGITAGSNGNIWFTEASARNIGEYVLIGNPPPHAAPTLTALAVDVSAPSVGQAVNLTATVSSASGTPSGTVTFFDGNTALGTSGLNASGQAVLPTVFHSAGSQIITAVFNGAADFAPSRSQVLHEQVSAASTTTTLSASANPAPVGHKLLLTVKVTPAFTGAGAPSGTVILSDGANTIAFATLDSSGQAVFTFTPGQIIKSGHSHFTVLPKGTHHLKVTYSGDGNFAASVSAIFDLIVV
jgi:streptogramin lyase